MANRTITIPTATDQTSSPSHADVHAGHAGGWLGYAEDTSGQSGITTEADLTGLTVTVTVPSDRRIKVTGYIRVNKSDTSGSASDIELRIKEGSTTKQIARDSIISGTGVGNAQTLRAEWIGTPTSGSKTYKLTLAAESGTVRFDADATYPGFILVEDIGPAS